MRFDRTLLTELLRGVLGLTYLFGGSVHVYFWATDQRVYAEITQFVLIDKYRAFWTDFVLPNLDALLPMLAVFEAFIAIAILSKGQIARIGLAAGGAFNLAVAPLGFWWPSNVVLAALHMALLRVSYTETAVERVLQ
ncbi:hypothetical protein HSRCO_1557 [Halanaeroarchaeum sp. HSR-CO]|uniref:hypothetical protein n=1 Tax=Halanaeroarchaeum sp. HSR-CO TaxID=2866382 RepID=UPI00217DEF5D|nr:hypothetical protein [Halanaeroarchaeum sp. HSR-CO]UWG47837.1 hypothetical protein HSRCO_1557 [Halanaeroarchaeum sp. HSR-CO]